MELEEWAELSFVYSNQEIACHGDVVGDYAERGVYLIKLAQAKSL
jgi:hypothetical protein